MTDESFLVDHYGEPLSLGDKVLYLCAGGAKVYWNLAVIVAFTKQRVRIATHGDSPYTSLVNPESCLKYFHTNFTYDEWLDNFEKQQGGPDANPYVDWYPEELKHLKEQAKKSKS